MYRKLLEKQERRGEGDGSFAKFISRRCSISFPAPRGEAPEKAQSPVLAEILTALVIKAAALVRVPPLHSRRSIKIPQSPKSRYCTRGRKFEKEFSNVWFDEIIERSSPNDLSGKNFSSKRNYDACSTWKTNRNLILKSLKPTPSLLLRRGKNVLVEHLKKDRQTRRCLLERKIDDKSEISSPIPPHIVRNTQSCATRVC